MSLRVRGEQLDELFADPSLVSNVEEFCKPLAAVTEDVLGGYSCSAGHTACYIAP